MKRVVLLGCAGLFVACAMQRSPASAPRSAEEAPPPAAPAGSAAAEPAPGGDADKATSAPAATPAPKAPTAAGAGGMVVMPGDVAAAQAQLDAAQKAFTAAGSDCIQLCKSLISMTNATEHLCGLVQGTTDESRCTDARARLSAAQAKVKSSCGNTCG